MLRSSVSKTASPLVATAKAAAAPATLRRAGLATLAKASRAPASTPLSARAFGPARPSTAAATLATRSFSSTRAARSKDTSWVNKGTVSYDELKPYTEAPSGVRVAQ